MKKWSFFKWTRDNQKAFADAVSEELNTKASNTTMNNLLSGKVSKNGDIVNGVLTVRLPTGSGSPTFPLVLQGKYRDGEYSTEYIWKLGISTISPGFFIRYNNQDVIGLGVPTAFYPKISTLTLGADYGRWANTFTKKLNNGADIEIPNKAGTMALVSDIEDILRQHGLIPAENTEQNEQQGVENA